MLYGVGVTDIKLSKSQRAEPPFQCWRSMLTRCYSDKFLARNPSYKGCSVVSLWHTYSKFLEWYSNQDTEGKQLDKDLKVLGNKTYGPDTCLFVTHEVNNLLHNQSHIRGQYPQGVKLKAKTGRFSASISIKGKDKHLGYFSTPAEAHEVYLSAKKALVLSVIEKTECRETREALRRFAN